MLFFTFILLIILINKIFSYGLNLQERFDFYDNDNKILYTPSTNFNNNYYYEAKYFYQLIFVEDNFGIAGFSKESCLTTCQKKIEGDEYSKNIVAVIGFNVNYLVHNLCECKGSLVKVNQFSYPYILNITNYNPDFHQLGQEIFVDSTRTISSSAKSNCYDSLMKIIKLEKGEAYTDYTLKSSNDDKSCNCSAKPLILKA